MRGWVSSAHRDARRIVVERCARPVRDAFASSVVRPVRVRARRLSVSLSLSRARDDERGPVRVASRRPVDARRARARRSSAMHERLTNDGGALCQPSVSTQMRARDATTPLRA